MLLLPVAAQSPAPPMAPTIAPNAAPPTTVLLNVSSSLHRFRSAGLMSGAPQPPRAATSPLPPPPGRGGAEHEATNETIAMLDIARRQANELVVRSGNPNMLPPMRAGCRKLFA
jgi:hypothetical protein